MRMRNVESRTGLMTMSETLKPYGTRRNCRGSREFIIWNPLEMASKETDSTVETIVLDRASTMHSYLDRPTE
jgi:hypothetical protein